MKPSAFALDLRALAVFRVGLALAVMADIASRLAVWRVFFTDDGPWPAAAARAASLPSLSWVSTAPAWTVALVAAQALFAVMLALGWQTRVAVVASWALLVSVHARNALVLHGGDLELRLLLFWSMWLPLGARASLDARRAPSTATVARSAASAALLLQVAMIYVTSALLKHDPAWWRTGDAVREALSLASYTRPLATHLLAWPRALRAVTWATLALEIVGPLIVFAPWRRRALRVAVPLAFALFHLGLALTLKLGLFPLIGALGWVPFLPLSREEKPLSSPSRVTSLAVAFCFALAAMCAARPWLPHLPPGPLYDLARALRLDQRWDLFAPRPMQHDSWFIALGTLPDGRELDLDTGRAPTWSPPRTWSSLYPTVRWRRYDASLRRGAVAPLREFAAWKRRCFVRAHPEAPAFARVTVVRVMVSTRNRADVTSETLYTWPEAP